MHQPIKLYLDQSISVLGLVVGKTLVGITYSGD